MIDVQDDRLDLLTIASATDCPNRARPACQACSAERRHAERQFWRGEGRFAAVGWGRSLLVLGFLDSHDAESRATISWPARKVAGRVEGGRPCTSPSCGAIR
jgi:hypothetical protein